jgi:hypothetical protein
MVTGIDSSLLLSLYQSKANQTAATVGSSALATAAKKVAPTAPWSASNAAATTAATSAAVKAAMAGRKFVNEGSAKLDVPGASADYRKIFALYQGLATLTGVAEQAGSKGILAAERGRIGQVFDRGLKEILEYVDDLDLDQLRVIQGDVSTFAKPTLGVPKTKTEYTTPPLVTGTSNTPVDAFQGAVQFNIQIKKSGTTVNVPIDLSGLTGTRSVATVSNYINQQLQAAGAEVRFATQRIPGGDKFVKVGGKDVKVGTNPDQWALKVKTTVGETVSFSTTSTAGAVYVAQDAGNPNPDGKADTKDSTEAAQFLKFQTDNVAVAPPLQRAGEANFVDGRVFGQTLGPEVKTVRDTKVGADGSVYLLADVVDKVAGQDIKGDQDVALLKYDSSGQLVFARTLGAAEEASGLGLALAADGKIAVAGSVKGVLSGSTDGALNSTGAFDGLTDSFVTLYDADGQELWTQRRGARQGDEASEVAFGADGTVYVSGRTSSALPGTTALGQSDAYLEAFKQNTTTGKVDTLFTTAFGTAGIDKPAGLVVDGTSVITASVENGRGVLRRYDVSGGTPVLSSTQDLGDLQGGSITGLALDGSDVIVAGSTSNTGLNGLTVTKANAGGTDAFAARISKTLTGGGQVAYYGGAGEDKATSLAVSGGQVWIAGSAGTDLPSNPTAVGTKDGFLARLNIGTGAVEWSRRFTGKDGRATPTSIAVDTTGSSVLDRIGLPKGELDMTDSPRLTAVSSLRAGDTFTIKSTYGGTRTVTIEEKDTLDTLSTKIKRASGFNAKVTIVTIEGNKRSLRIEPTTDRATLEFGAGKIDKDALAMLGIPEGIVRKTTTEDGKIVPADGKGMIYGLALDGKLNLDDETSRKYALSEIDAAMGKLRTAYRDLVAAASPQRQTQAGPGPVSGPVPAYLTNQIANYQAALARLGG